MRPPKLLIIEDEERMRRLFELVLKQEGYDLLLASTGEQGIRTLHDVADLDLIVTDLQLGKQSGLDVLEAAKRALPDVPVLIITGYGTVKSAVEAMKKGAYDYISKPVDNEELKIVLARALQVRQLSQDKRALTEAKKAKAGRFQLADRGTLFLDEIGEMSLAAQAKLLRVLEDHTVEPLGGGRGVKVDNRVICATNQTLPELIRKGSFRE